MNWYQLWTKHEDYKIYLAEEQMKSYICSNQKCSRILKDIEIDFKYRRKSYNFALLPFMRLYIISQRFLDVLREYSPNDFSAKNLGNDMYILTVTSQAVTNPNCIRTEGICPECKNPLWRGFYRDNKRTSDYYFIKPERNSIVLCRSSETTGDSYNAQNLLFCNEVLAEKLQKLFSKDLFLEKCLNN